MPSCSDLRVDATHYIHKAGAVYQRVNSDSRVVFHVLLQTCTCQCYSGVRAFLHRPKCQGLADIKVHHPVEVLTIRYRTVGSMFHG